MIDKQSLAKLAKISNLRLWQQERHYLQSLILVALAEFPLVFKGGTYLFFFHGLKRFSEDLDFTGSGDFPSSLAHEVSESLRLFGIRNSERVEADDERRYSFRISAEGPLYTSPIDASHVYVEISRREAALGKPIPFRLENEAYMMPVKMVSGMALEEVAAEKVRALMTRNKARDLYDLAFLIRERSAPFDRAMARAKLGYYGLDFSPELLAERTSAMEAAWKPELKPLIFGELMEYETARSGVMKWASAQL